MDIQRKAECYTVRKREKEREREGEREIERERDNRQLCVKQ